MKEPTNKIIAYKVFFVNNKYRGKLFPPMVANPDRDGTPVGVWVQASTGEFSNAEGKYIKNFGKRVMVKQGGKGTKGGSGELAFRAGWHLGDKPKAQQFLRKSGLYPEKIIFAECEIAADYCYQTEALEYAMSSKGNFNRHMVTTPFIPYEGFYVYRTNPNPDTPSWFITGGMKVNRILSDEEISELNGEFFKRENQLNLDQYELDYKIFDSHPIELHEVDNTLSLLEFDGYTRRPLDFNSDIVKNNFLECYLKINKTYNGFEDWYSNLTTINTSIGLKETLFNHPVLKKYYRS